MGLFKEFVTKHSEFIDFILEQNMVPSVQAKPNFVNQYQPETVKPWSAKKSEILQMWRNFRQDMPVIMTPISDDLSSNSQGNHSTYGEDGIRLTGSWHFISSVLSRLKEILGYENPQQKLRLIFRGIDKTRGGRPDRHSYVFYCNLENREFGKPGRVKNKKGFS